MWSARGQSSYSGDSARSISCTTAVNSIERPASRTVTFDRIERLNGDREMREMTSQFDPPSFKNLGRGVF
jgi:hypothetical protein